MGRGRFLVSRKSGRKVVSILAVLALLLTLVPVAPVLANVEAGSVEVTADSYKAGALTSYTIGFSNDATLSAGDQLAVIFPSGFNDSNAGVEKVTVNGDVYSFTSQHPAPGIWQLYYTGSAAVPANVQYAVYFSGVVNPTKAGSYNITVRAPYPSDPGQSGSVEIVPADPVKLAIKGITDEDPASEGIQVTAGTQQNISVVLVDQYGNEGAVTDEAITVKLSDTDPQENFDGDQEEATLTIPENASSSDPVSWTPKTAGTVTLSAATAEGSPSMQPASVAVQVTAASPAEILLAGPSYLDKDEEGAYTLTLRDAYDNTAKAPAEGLSVSLSADPGSGVTFDPASVTVNAGESTATFTFKSSQADMYTIKASPAGLPAAEQKVAVGVTVLNTLAVTAPATGEVGIASEISLALKDQFGNSFAAPEGGVAITLATDNSGSFYNQPANGVTITEVTILEGQSSAKVYYVSATDAVGVHNLSFSTAQVLSDGNSTGATVTAEATINVGTAAELWLDVQVPGFTAGERGEITITVRDSHWNEVRSGESGRLVYLETESPTGKFYAAAEGGDPITQVTIPAGQASVKVYYVDNESWTKKAMADGKLSAYGLAPADYSYTLAFRSEGVMGYSAKAVVQPAATTSITLQVSEQSVDAVDDEEYVQIGSRIGATDIIGVAYMRVGVVDQYENPVPQNPLLRISLEDDSASAFLWSDYAELENGEWAEKWDAWLIVTAPGAYQVTASAGGLTGAEAEVTFAAPALAIAVGDVVAPDARVPVTISLTNLWASGRDLPVELSASSENSAFYASDQAAEPVSTVTIPAYDNRVTVWFESDDPEGTAVELTAAIADLALSARATVDVGLAPSGSTAYQRGWNIVSTPWALADGKNTIDQILEHPEYVEGAYGYADGQWFAVTSADPDTMVLRPLEALYVKLKGETGAAFWAKRGLGTPPVRPLAAGWNLVGNPADEDKPDNEALSSISGSYAVVISPGLNQEGWVYTPQQQDSEFVETYRGYWVYMTTSGNLAGQAMPPVQ